MDKYPDLSLGAITVKKELVSPYIRRDANVLYNYMMRVALSDKIQDHQSCKITRDNRNVKVASGNSCIDYLQTFIWLENNKPVVLVDNPKQSHTDDGLIFIDWITNIVWSKYEDKCDQWCSQIQGHLKEMKLYF